MTSDRHPRLRLCIASGTLAVSLAVVDLLMLMAYAGVGRVRDAGLVSLVMAVVPDFPVRDLPAFVNRPFAFGSSWLVPGVCFVILSNLAVFLSLAAIAWLFVRTLPKAVERVLIKDDQLPGFLILIVSALPIIRHSVIFMIGEAMVWAGAEPRWNLILPLVIIPSLFVFGIVYLHHRRALVAMFRFRWLWGTVNIVGVCTLTVAWFGFTLQGHKPIGPAEAGPNVLLVSIDSLRSDHLSCYGYEKETSPTIDRLAAEGVLFETAVSPTSWTLPAHLTLLTGLPPEGHGVIHDWQRLKAQARTLAEVLHEAGYYNLAVVSGPYLDASYGFHQGFDVYDDFTAMPQVGYPVDWSTAESEVTSPRFFDATEKWIRDWDREGRQRPFFAFLHMWDVHYDFNPPAPYDTMFDPDYTGNVTSKDFIHSDQIHPQMDPRDLEHILALYDGEIRYTDYYFDKILGVLEDLGELDNTIVIVTSDHGDEFFEHGDKGHHKTLYDEVIRVPLVARFPQKIPAARRVEQQVGLMDVAPTILALAGVARPVDFARSAGGTSIAARDLTPLILEENVGDEQPPAAFGDLHGKLASIRTQTMKMIVRFGKDHRSEVYDLMTDAAEQVNLATRDSAATTALGEALTAWRDAHAQRDGMSESTAVSADQLKVLRSLGYVQ